jgi:protein gp37
MRIANRFGTLPDDGRLHDLNVPISEMVSAGGYKVGPKQPYPYSFAPTFHRYKLDEPQHWKKPRSIFVCSMADLFGEWVPDNWIDEVVKSTQEALQHRYLFLTKNPARYDDWLDRFENSKIDGLDEIQNCWFGASASNNAELQRANESRAMWLSIEPIRERIGTDEHQFMEFYMTPNGELERPRWAWVVIGAETGNQRGKVVPEKSWINEIVDECRAYDTPVFMKESLREIMGNDFKQEFPW